VNGQATVVFSDHFQIVASQQNVTVHLTPKSASSKGLAVVEETATGFVVKELWNGQGNYEFYWEISAVRKGYEDYEVIRNANEARPATVEQPADIKNEQPNVGQNQQKQLNKPSNSGQQPATPSSKPSNPVNPNAKKVTKMDKPRIMGK